LTRWSIRRRSKWAVLQTGDKIGFIKA